MASPFFSVIISAFNRGDMLRSALKSIEFQTFRDFECLAVNDGSTDNVPDVIAAFTQDERFRVLTNSKNQGMNAARNMALKVARGRFIAFLDSDDIWLPDHLGAFHERLARPPGPGFLFSNAYVLRFNRLIGKLFPEDKDIPEGAVPGYYAIGDRYLPCLTTNIAIRKDAFERWGDFAAGFKATDTELFARFLSKGLTVGVIRRPLAVRRLHEDQITAGHAENFRQSMNAVPSSGAPADVVQNLRRDVAVEVATALIKAGRPGEVRGFLRDTLGPGASELKVWKMSYIPAIVLKSMAWARQIFLRVRRHPALLATEYRKVWELISPLLNAEMGGRPT